MTKAENWNTLGDEEKARLRAKTPIAADDAEAVSTVSGWARWLARARELRAAMTAEGPDVPNARFWACSTRAGAKKAETLFVECERGGDARKAAALRLGVLAVDIAALDEGSMPRRPLPRLQVRWAGSAAGRAPDLRLQSRLLDEKGAAGKWADAR